MLSPPVRAAISLRATSCDLAVAALTALWKSIQYVRKEAQRAEEAIKRLSKSNTELGQQSLEASKSILAERAATA